MTGMIATNQRAHDVYGRIENPMVFIEAMGKVFHQSAIMGVHTPGDGQVLALTCMCEGITPLEFAKTYHIINGRPSMRADMMLAKFRAAGGKIEWKNIGDDGKFAEATFAYDGQTMPVRYTIEDADKLMGADASGKRRIEKEDSNWKKDRGAMLRARLITKAIRMLAPELIAGVYTPEEIEDVTPQKAVVNDDVKKAQEIRRAELLADVHPPVVKDDVIDVAAESPTVAETEKPSTNEQRQELVRLASKCPSPSGSGNYTITEISENICKAAGVKTPQEATFKQMESLIARFRTLLGAV